MRAFLHIALQHPKEQIVLENSEKPTMPLEVRFSQRFRNPWDFASVLAVAGVGFGLAGCGIGASSAVDAVQPVAQMKVQGSVFGGQQPVSGASVQLYAVGTSGLKSQATALLSPAVSTNSSGVFSITGLYSCTNATQVYLVATGGNSGSGVNSAIALMAPLGLCSTLQANASTTFIQINEISTIASVYALAPFMADITHIGASGSNPTGLLNAVANFNNLYNLTTGAAGGASLSASASVPVSELNTLANILASCINTSSSTSATCNTLLTTTSSSNTVNAALAIANNPGSSAMTGLFSLATASVPFQPTLTSTPNDWTVAIKYSAGGTLNAPYGIAIDAGGNAWVTNTGGSALTEITASGATYTNFTGGNLLGAKGVAIDRSGNIWVANTPFNTVVKFNGSGLLPVSFSAGSLNGPVALALDSAGNAWIANQAGSSVSKLSNTGSSVLAASTASSTISYPTGIALDGSGNVYVANSGPGNVVELTHAGAVAASSPLTDNALQGAFAVAVDSSANVWETGSITGSAVAGAVSQFFAAGSAVAYSPISGGGLNMPVAAALSGSTLWVVNANPAGSLSELQLTLSSPASPSGGFGSLNAPSGVAVDSSGNVWTTDSGDNSVSVFIGLTTPVTTPIAATVGP